MSQIYGECGVACLRAPRHRLSAVYNAQTGYVTQPARPSLPSKRSEDRRGAPEENIHASSAR